MCVSFLVSELSCGVHAVLALAGEWGEQSCVQRLDDEFVKSQKIAFSKSVHNTSYGVGMFVSDGIEVIVLG